MQLIVQEIAVPYSIKLALFLPIAIFCAPAGAAQDGAPLAGQGMVVVRDAENGQLRTATPPEFRALHQNQRQRSMQGSSARVVASKPPLVVGPGGRRSVRLGESHLVYAVVTRDSDDRLVEQCTDGAHDAERLVARPGPATGHGRHTHERR